MGFVPQPVLAAVVAALATIVSLSCADSHQATDPSFEPNVTVRPPRVDRAEGEVRDVVKRSVPLSAPPEVAERQPTEAEKGAISSEIRAGT